MARILLVGTATLDLVFELDHHPAPDEEMRARSLRTCRGGNAANTAVVLSRMGHQVEFLGVMAEAPETVVIERDLAKHGVNFHHCPKLPGLPPTSSIYLTGQHRSIVHQRDLPELSAHHFSALDIAAFDVVHFECRNVEAVREMMVCARQQAPGLMISLELEKVRPGMEALYPYPDLFICSRGFAMHHGYSDPRLFLSWMADRTQQALVIAAWGEHGAYGISAGQFFHAPALEVNDPIDTLGAGDTFNAGVLDGYSHALDMQKIIDDACVLAGRKCCIQGFEFDVLL